ncbi:hypothetical protein RB195_022919 [Necator americanus]|uniref:Armadillo/beta-catenin-like repeat protein n=1 Tax=Necator americanus TaxID=51031 RepID=A0ABR1EH48_NECAM
MQVFRSAGLAELIPMLYCPFETVVKYAVTTLRNLPMHVDTVKAQARLLEVPVLLKLLTTIRAPVINAAFGVIRNSALLRANLVELTQQERDETIVSLIKLDDFLSEPEKYDGQLKQRNTVEVNYYDDHKKLDTFVVDASSTDDSVQHITKVDNGAEMELLQILENANNGSVVLGHMGHAHMDKEKITQLEVNDKGKTRKYERTTRQDLSSLRSPFATDTREKTRQPTFLPLYYPFGLVQQREKQTGPTSLLGRQFFGPIANTFGVQVIFP